MNKVYVYGKTSGRYTYRQDQLTLYVDENNNLNIYNPESLHNAPETILNDLNNLINEEGVVLQKGELPKTLVVHDNKIWTKGQYLALRQSKNTKELPNKTVEFEGGIKIEPLVGQEYTKWIDEATTRSSTSVANNTDAAYKVVNNGTIETVFTTKKKMLSGIFSQAKQVGYDDGERQPYKLPVHKTLDFTNAPYIRAFADKNGIVYKNKSFNISQDSRAGKFLVELSRSPRARTRTNVMQSIGINPMSVPGYDAPYNNIDRPLVDTGLVRLQREGRRYLLTITQRGRTMAERINQGEEISWFELTGSADHAIKDQPIEQPEPTKEPEVAPTPERTPRRTAERQAGTKAQQAYDRFVEMTRANNGTTPSRAEFMRILQGEPFNMTPAGSGTYFHNIKTKYQQNQGNLGETYTFMKWVNLIWEKPE